PLTLGLSFIVAIMHTLYYKTGSKKWGSATRFWMKLFGINFAIGVATGIILEFEFGTNWSNYSWLVGDIFGAPLAIEGIMAFFLESTFIVVMLFGWERVSKKLHLTSSWLVAIGSNLSALWILVANAWMQDPVGMKFNADTARNEMMNFWEIILSPTAVHKFLHTISQAYVISAIFVIGVSAWYLLKKRHILFAKRSIIIAAVFGLIAAIFVAGTGDASGHDIAQKQPMKLAAMEGLYKGQQSADLTIIGVLTPGKIANDDKKEFVFNLAIPGLLSYLCERDFNSYVPGIEDLINGNEEHGILSTDEKMKRGKIAIESLAAYKKAQDDNDLRLADEKLEQLESNYDYLGYGYFSDKKDTIPNVPIVFYSFHLMVGLGMFFILLFIMMLYSGLKNKLENNRMLLKIALWTIPLGYLASQLGWVVTEVGRQPWTIQNILPTIKSTSDLSSGSVQITFWIFLVLFTLLLIADIRILTKQIKIGPKEL
ncbi:cytochrome ubiquinol oxidase subunit I, partial [Bacteroidota bacterium]